MGLNYFNDPDKEKVWTSIQHFILGKSYLEKNDLDGAITEYEKAIQLDPGYLKAHEALAKAYLAKARKTEHLSHSEKKHFFNKAIRHLREIVSLSPESKISQDAEEMLEDIPENY